MKVNFEYEKDKDIWCLLNYGKSSNNSQAKTKVYEKLISEYGENPTAENTSVFVDKYILEKKINLQEQILNYQTEWNNIAEEYKKIAEKVFGVNLKNDITAFLTVNNRCPYNISQNYFFVSFPTFSMKKTVMHELWHFYTWEKFGSDWENKLGKQKYNDLKESLTVLLNAKCRELLGNIQDSGYPQHQELRENIFQIWNQEKDINIVWEKLSKINF